MSSKPAPGEAELTAEARKALEEAIKNGLIKGVQNALMPWLDILEIVTVSRTSPTTSRAVFRWPVQPEYLNPSRGLHGGMSAGMLDVVTGLTLWPIRQPGFWMLMGTSRTLNMTFLRPAAEGEMLICESEVVHAGKRLCLIKAILKREREMGR